MPSVEITCVETDCVQAIEVDIPDDPDEAAEADPVECQNCGHEYYPGYWRDDEPTAYPSEDREKPSKFVQLENHEETMEHIDDEGYDLDEHGEPPEKARNADNVLEAETDAGAPDPDNL